MFPTAAGSARSFTNLSAAEAMLAGFAPPFNRCSRIRTFASSSANFRSKYVRASASVTPGYCPTLRSDPPSLTKTLFSLSTLP